MTLIDPTGQAQVDTVVSDWEDLGVLPSGPRATVASAITKRIFTMAARRLGVPVVGPSDTPPSGYRSWFCTSPRSSTPVSGPAG